VFILKDSCLLTPKFLAQPAVIAAYPMQTPRKRPIPGLFPGYQVISARNSLKAMAAYGA
jgi:hypothetical protein